MSPARGSSRTAPKPEAGDAQPVKISLLEKWKWARAVVADHDIPREALATGFVVADLVDQKLGYAFAGQEYIAEAVGLSKTAVHGHIKRLATRGHLGVKRRGKLGANHYFLLQKSISADGGSGGDEFKPDGIHNPENRPHEFKPGGIHGRPEAADEFKLEPGMNSSQLDATKPFYQAKRESALSQPCDLRDRQAGQADDVGRSASPPRHNSQVEHGPERQAIDARWIEAAGPDLARSLSRDPEGTNRLHDAIACGDFTAEDVETAIVDFRHKHPDEPRRFWGFFTTWAQNSARKRSAGQLAEASTARPAETGPTVAIPGHATTRWPADSVTQWAARWWSEPNRWEDCLGEPPDRPDPRRSLTCQAAVDAGREAVVAAIAVWRRDPASWDRNRLGPAPHDLASSLGVEFGFERVKLRSGVTVTVFALDRHLRVLAEDFGDDEFVRCYRALPSPLDAEDCILPLEWQRKALEYRATKS